MLIASVAQLGVVCGQLPGLTGVWVQPDALSRCRDCPPEKKHLPAKIAAIGVKVDSRGVSRHGFALNVNPDMAYWEGIVGCGLDEYPVASLAQLLQPTPSMYTVMDSVESAFGKIFNYEMVPAILAGRRNSFDTAFN
jgi:lipoate-protein ligase B